MSNPQDEIKYLIIPIQDTDSYLKVDLRDYVFRVYTPKITQFLSITLFTSIFLIRKFYFVAIITLKKLILMR